MRNVNFKLVFKCVVLYMLITAVCVLFSSADQRNKTEAPYPTGGPYNQLLKIILFIEIIFLYALLNQPCSFSLFC